MKDILPRLTVLAGFLLFVIPMACIREGEIIDEQAEEAGSLLIGWASTDISPERPVLLAGQSYARISEGIMDPLTATALAMEYGTGPSSGKVIMISCDLLAISDGTRDGFVTGIREVQGGNLRDGVRHLVCSSLPGLDPHQIILNATHTHEAPVCGADSTTASVCGVEIDAMAPYECTDYISARIAEAAEKAWKSRKPGGISYGLGHAVVGHNRLQANFSGKSVMYGKIELGSFSHMEGYEDHSVNLLYTWDDKKRLTGVVINLACPSQATENSYLISSDFWHDTRLELRSRLGDDLHILPQSSAAGDQSPHVMIGKRAEIRMQQLMFADSNNQSGADGRRKQIAWRIADAVTSVLTYVKDSIDWDPEFEHRMEQLELSRRMLDLGDLDQARSEQRRSEERYEELLSEIRANPGMKDDPHWYRNVTLAYTSVKRALLVQERFELLQRQPRMPVEVHVLRIGDVVFATNPFELYLDYAIRMKAHSPAVQTFVIQLAGGGTYLPTARSVAGGAYGAVPASTLVGPEGGRQLVEGTLEMIRSLW